MPTGPYLAMLVGLILGAAVVAGLHLRRAERADAHREATIVLALAMLTLPTAFWLLPLEPAKRAFVIDDPVKTLALAVATIAVPLAYVVLTLIARWRGEPGGTTNIVGAVAAFLWLAPVALTIAVEVLEAGHAMYRSHPAWLLVAALWPVLALLAVVRTIRDGSPWRKWAHALAAPAAALLTFFAVFLSKADEHRIDRFVGVGGYLLFLALGLSVPVVLYVLFAPLRAATLDNSPE